ncbi:MAG: hypothetical protein WC955_07205 [Elusimicrobiota bacterium]
MAKKWLIFIIICITSFTTTNVYAKWVEEIVGTNNPDDGAGCSLIIDFMGNPRVSYINTDTGGLAYSCRLGKTWKITVVDTTTVVSNFTSIDLDKYGYPHIAYYDAINKDLRYAYYNGETWYTEIVDSKDDVGSAPSLKLDNAGLPWIGYYDETNTALKCAHKTGSKWQITTVDNGPNVGSTNNLCLDSSGCPHIVYSDAVSQVLKYAFWDNKQWEIEMLNKLGSRISYGNMFFNKQNDLYIFYIDLFGKIDFRYAVRKSGEKQWRVETIESLDIIYNLSYYIKTLSYTDSAGKLYAGYCNYIHNCLVYCEKSKSDTKWNKSDYNFSSSGDSTIIDYSMSIDRKGMPYFVYWFKNKGLRLVKLVNPAK